MRGKRTARLLGVLLALTLTAGLLPMSARAESVPFDPNEVTIIDVPIPVAGAQHEAWLYGSGGRIRPNDPLTRAECAEILYRLMTPEAREALDGGETGFSDVPDGAWYGQAVLALAQKSVFLGFADGTFRPDEAMTRAEWTAVLSRYLETEASAGKSAFSDTAGSWAGAEIAAAAAEGWVRGYPDGTFRPDAPVTRAEAAATLCRALGRMPGRSGDLLSGMKTWTDNADSSAWYYLILQEASNSHNFESYTGSNGKTYEKWTALF